MANKNEQDARKAVNRKYRKKFITTVLSGLMGVLLGGAISLGGMFSYFNPKLTERFNPYHNEPIIKKVKKIVRERESLESGLVFLTHEKTRAHKYQFVDREKIKKYYNGLIKEYIDSEEKIRDYFKRIRDYDAIKYSDDPEGSFEHTKNCNDLTFYEREAEHLHDTSALMMPIGMISAAISSAMSSRIYRKNYDKKQKELDSLES